MLVKNQDIIVSNRNTYKRNCAARYNSQEEKKFTLSSVAGLLLMWSPYASKEETPCENVIDGKDNGSIKSSKNTPSCLPPEIGQMIGSYLNRKDAASVAQVCKNANICATVARKIFIEKNGKSYIEEAYMPLFWF